MIAPLQQHYRAELIITPYVGETVVAGEPITAHAFVPVSIEVDASDPRVRAEIIDLVADGFKFLAEDLLGKAESNAD